jgi:hypothetical protein
MRRADVAPAREEQVAQRFLRRGNTDNAAWLVTEASRRGLLEDDNFARTFEVLEAMHGAHALRASHSRALRQGGADLLAELAKSSVPGPEVREHLRRLFAAADGDAMAPLAGYLAAGESLSDCVLAAEALGRREEGRTTALFETLGPLRQRDDPWPLPVVATVVAAADGAPAGSARSLLAAARAQDLRGEAVAEVAGFVQRFGGVYAADLIALLTRTPAIIPLTDVHAEGFGPALAAGLAADLPPEVYAQAANVINEVHNHDDAADKMRKSFTLSLTPAAAYRLLADGGSAMYNSTFQQTMATFQRHVPRFVDALPQLDPAHDHLPAFLDTLLRYDQEGLLVSGLDVLWPPMQRRILDPDQGPEAVAKTARFLRAHFSKVPAPLRLPFEQALMAQAESTGSPACKYLLRTLGESRGLLSGDAIAAANALPPVPTVELPAAAWRADKAITAKLYFHDAKDTWYAHTARFLQAKGFHMDRVYQAQHGIDGDDTEVYRRVVAGISERVILTRSAFLQGTEFDAGSDVDIVAHRDHSYHFQKTFRPRQSVAGQRELLLIGGSCNSYDDMVHPDFLRDYGQSQLLSDINTGEGATNNAILLAVMDAAAHSRKATVPWKDVRLGDVTTTRGIRLPDDPSMLLARYQAVLAAQKAQAL